MIFEISLIGDKIVVWIDREVKIYSLETHDLLRTEHFTGYGGTRIWKCGHSLMIPAKDDLKMLNLETLETSSEDIHRFLPQDFNQLRSGCNDRVAIFIGKCLNMFLWSFESKKMSKMYIGTGDEQVDKYSFAELWMNSKFMVINLVLQRFDYDNGKGSPLLKFQFFENDSNFQSLIGNGFIDITPKEGMVESLVMNEANLMAFTHSLCTSRVMKIFDLVTEMTIFTFDQNPEDLNMLRLDFTMDQHWIVLHISWQRR